MDTPIAHILDVVVTPWKLVGYLGVLLFAGRWVVQMLATRRQGRPAFPGLFWTMSLSGSALLLIYFVWGKSDSVGVLSNLFPMAVAAYNLVMHRRAAGREPADADPPQRTASRSSRRPDSADGNLPTHLAAN
jgi:lipid-A-disaccharide synthase-like uncharacterized protein